MLRRRFGFLSTSLILMSACRAVAQQIVVSQIGAMPDLAYNYQYMDYSAAAQGFDSTVFNPVAQAGYQYKSFWFQNDFENGIATGFGMPSYIGQTQASTGNGEGITTIAAVLGASLVGINKQSQTLSNGGTYDFVQMASRYYDSGTGANLVLNNIGSSGTGSFWYDQTPQILFDGLISQYYSSYAPGSAGQQRLDTVMTNGAAKMHNVIDVLAGNSTTATPNFNYQGFNYATMQPISGGHTEPDGAAGAAYEQYVAYVHTGNATNLSDAERAMNALQNTPANQNPLYETVLPFGALTAARLNAEHGTNYDVAKMVNWSFSPTSVVRPGWGAISAAQWNGYGAAGLIGSTTDQGGYGFSMNSYIYPMAMVPLVRYDDRFANSIGKWMLNLSNSSRMFFKNGGLPASNQTNAGWNDAPSNYYSYEGVKESSNGISPLAGGDGTGYNPAWLNFAYGSGDVGALGSIISQTNVSQILQLNLLATDFFHAAAYPSYLVYNPYATQQTVQINVGATAVNIYDAVTNQVIASNVSGTTSITIPADTARSLVYTPVGGAFVDNGQNITVNGIVVNYRSPQMNNLYWDLNGSANGAGGSDLTGTWNSSNSNWNNNSAGTNSTIGWISGDVANFAAGSDGGGTYTVSVVGTQTIAGLNFLTGNVTLSGGAFTLAADSYITAASGTQTISTPISGSFALIANGSGTLALSGTNTQNGLTLMAGTVSVASAASLGGGTINFAAPSTLSFSGSAAVSVTNSVSVNSTSTINVADLAGVTLQGSLAMNGTLIKTGEGTLTLAGAASGNQSIEIRNGSIVAASNSPWASSDNPPGVSVGDSSSPSNENLGVLLNSGVTISSGRIFFQPYALQGTKTLGGTFTSGSATINTYVHLLSSAINLQITDAPGGQFNLPLGILGSNAAGITIVGGGTVSLGGLGAARSEYFQGVTTVENGTLLLSGNDIVGNARDTYVLGNSSYTQAVQLGDSNTPVNGNVSLLTNGAVTINHAINVNNFGNAISIGGASASTSTFNSNISLLKSVSLVSGGGVTNFGGSITGTGAITAGGSGTVKLTGNNSYGGGTNVSGGATLTIAAAGSLPAGSTVINNGALNIIGSSTSGNISGVGTLTIGDGVNPFTLTLATNSGGSSQNVLVIKSGSTLDLSNNHLFINYGSGPDPISSIAALIASGYSGGTWTGAGITSSTAKNNANSYGIGYADSADPGNPAGLAAGQIEIKYTLLGDANLDGEVNGSDFAILASNFNKAVSGWDQGDFNYDGSDNGADFATLAANFNQGASQSDVASADTNALDQFAAQNGLIADVPEPACATLVITAMLGMALRRRGNRQE